MMYTYISGRRERAQKVSNLMCIKNTQHTISARVAHTTPDLHRDMRTAPFDATAVTSR